MGFFPCVVVVGDGDAQIYVNASWTLVVPGSGAIVGATNPGGPNINCACTRAGMMTCKAMRVEKKKAQIICSLDMVVVSRVPLM
jgi:hypothetical protein